MAGVPFFRDVSKVVRNLLERPASLARAVSEVMPQIVEGNRRDQQPLFLVGLSFERTKPVMNTGLTQPLAPLGREDIGTFPVSPTMAEIGVQRLAGFD